MNDFTKEELEIAKDGIGWMISELEMVHNKYEVAEWRCIKQKLQSMIDNYCEPEHKSDGNLYTRLGPAPYTMSVLREDEHKLFKNNRTRCVKCGEYYIL